MNGETNPQSPTATAVSDTNGGGVLPPGWSDEDAGALAELKRLRARARAEELFDEERSVGSDSALVRRSPREAAAVIDPPDLIEDMFPSRGKAEVFGPSGDGKTFVVLSIGGALATGAELWFGQQVRGPVDVVYLANEGAVGARLAALLEYLGVDDIPRFHVYTPHRDCRDGVGCLGVDLTSPASVTRFLRALERDRVRHGAGSGTVVFIDTKAGAAPGNENSPEWTAAVNAGMTAIAAWAGGVCCTVHHTGWEVLDRQRGHSGGFAALDVSIRVGGPVKEVIKVTKHKGTDQRLALPFEFRAVGESSVVVPRSVSTVAGKEAERIRKSLNAAHAVYRWVLDAHAGGQEWTATEFASQVSGSVASVSRAAARAAIKRLIEAGVFTTREDTRKDRQGRNQRVEFLEPSPLAASLWGEFMSREEGGKADGPAI